MAERFTSDLVFILVVLIVAAILGYILGYLSRKRTAGDNTALLQEIGDLKAQLAACRQAKGEPAPLFDASLAQNAMGKKIRENDLKIVEGIGEKIESILKSQGILSWKQLSETDASRISEILLKEGGPSYRIHDPGTWPEQCRLAHLGKWAELKEYQDKLLGGKQV